MANPADIKFYIEQLKGDECQCGRAKKNYMSFCYYCWKKLPFNMQRELYKKIRSGYEEAYDEAVEYLNS